MRFLAAGLLALALAACTGGETLDQAKPQGRAIPMPTVADFPIAAAAAAAPVAAPVQAHSDRAELCKAYVDYRGDLKRRRVVWMDDFCDHHPTPAPQKKGNAPKRKR